LSNEYVHLVLQLRLVLQRIIFSVHLVLQTERLLLQKVHLLLQRERLLLQIFEFKAGYRLAYKF